ncbi:heparinase II/III domain-containing protein [Sediminibacterium soli]|uniref:heparinase II/III domain-containing protein n=1 Tax=Sediminibacterium soli TaxID=2698829 RepID=UPI001379E61C|nr:heparinase II/III family protein [Sediminibacterium soli]NCI46827.1 heparinase [Sediminibacterium soli]
MKKIGCIVIGCLVGICLQAQPVAADVTLPSHPRILLLAGEEKMISASLQDPTWKAMHHALLQEAASFESKPPVEQIKIGKRLLDKSRECLRRVFFLSYAWRMTHEARYLARAEKELLAVSAFTDWNPSHFLDVAEMTMAAAIGYDWLYDGLSAASRKTIKDAILEKGLKASLEPKNNGWLRVSNNWNQVCNAGMSYGALAIYEEEPVMSHEIINRAISSVEIPMKEYAPDGAYPEGYNYWGYGTSFNVLLIGALEKAFGSDFGLAAKPGFLKTGAFLEHMVGASHKPFNFFDSGGSEELHPALFWFAERTSDPSLLWMEKPLLNNPASKRNLSDRLLPAIMIWGKKISMAGIHPPKALFWKGNGRNPLVMMRSSWTDTALYVGFKGGSPSSSHAHMDAGSFVLDADGLRWAMDFGMQDYENLESKGIDLWNMRQQSQRWKVFRYNNYAHNTLTVNDSLQRVEGMAELTDYSDAASDMNAVVDMSAVYRGQLAKSIRKISLLNKSSVQVLDRIQVADRRAVIRWTMATPATPKIIDAHTLELSRDGKKLLLSVKQPAAIEWKTWSTSPANAYDAANPGTTLVGFETSQAAGANAVIEVLLRKADK